LISSKDKTQEAFFALLQAGLWEKSVRLLPFSPIDFDALYKLAEEQSVVGLIAAGLEHVEDLTLEKRQVMPFMKRIITLESRNASMNGFIASLYTKMREAGIEALLVKGQGIAQCYERPMWRAAGDVDLLFDAENYEKAKAFLIPMASSVDIEEVPQMHLGMKIDSWTVELHGTLHCGLSRFMNGKVDQVQKELFRNRDFRIWHDGETDILLPGETRDSIFIFTHILQHFYRGGIGVRQICDWTRLLWTYRDSIDRTLLEQRITQMRLMTEWKSFAAFAVDYLGMPVEAMPLYDPAPRWQRKARRINTYILEVGNFGHNRASSYTNRTTYLSRKTLSFHYRLTDFLRHLAIAPRTSLTVFGRTLVIGMKAVGKGE
jgi:hypothetical protein